MYIYNVTCMKQYHKIFVLTYIAVYRRRRNTYTSKPAVLYIFMYRENMHEPINE